MTLTSLLIRDLQQWRLKHLDWKQRHVAHYIGVSESQFSDILAGRENLTSEPALKLSKLVQSK